MKEIVLVHPKEEGKLLSLVARLKSNPCEYEAKPLSSSPTLAMQ